MNAHDRDQAIRLLRDAVTRSKRKEQVPFASEFLRSDDGSRPPLARLIQGGRGGAVRLKLCLTITMMATRSPHDIQNPPSPRLWARTFGMSDAAAPRRVRTNLRWLHDNKFIELTPRPGGIPQITLLDPATETGAYTRPTTPYISLPLDLWSQGWILALSPTGLALFMVIRDIQQMRDEPRYANRQAHDSYHLSWDTWTRASKELAHHKLLHKLRLPQGENFDYQRMRNLYRIDLERLKGPPLW